MFHPFVIITFRHPSRIPIMSILPSRRNSMYKTHCLPESALAPMLHGTLIIQPLIQWNKTLSADLRFYDQERETLLYFFLQFMGIIAVVMLLPFLLTMRKNE